MCGVRKRFPFLQVSEKRLQKVRKQSLQIFYQTIIKNIEILDFLMQLSNYFLEHIPSDSKADEHETPRGKCGNRECKVTKGFISKENGKNLLQKLSGT